MAHIGMSTVGKEISEHERETMVQNIVTDSAPTVGHYMEGSVLAFEFSTNLATAKADPHRSRIAQRCVFGNRKQIAAYTCTNSPDRLSQAGAPVE